MESVRRAQACLEKVLLIRYVVVEEQRARIELHLLSSQIRPHFICNTLNTIANLVDKDEDATLRAIYDLSGKAGL